MFGGSIFFLEWILAIIGKNYRNNVTCAVEMMTTLLRQVQ